MGTGTGSSAGSGVGPGVGPGAVADVNRNSLDDHAEKKMEWILGKLSLGCVVIFKKKLGAMAHPVEIYLRDGAQEHLSLDHGMIKLKGKMIYSWNYDLSAVSHFDES